MQSSGDAQTVCVCAGKGWIKELSLCLRWLTVSRPPARILRWKPARLPAGWSHDVHHGQGAGVRDPLPHLGHRQDWVSHTIIIQGPRDFPRPAAAAANELPAPKRPCCRMSRPFGSGVFGWAALTVNTHTYWAVQGYDRNTALILLHLHVFCS